MLKTIKKFKYGLLSVIISLFLVFGCSTFKSDKKPKADIAVPSSTKSVLILIVGTDGSVNENIIFPNEVSDPNNFPETLTLVENGAGYQAQWIDDIGFYNLFECLVSDDYKLTSVGLIQFDMANQIYKFWLYTDNNTISPSEAEEYGKITCRKIFPPEVENDPRRCGNRI